MRAQIAILSFLLLTLTVAQAHAVVKVGSNVDIAGETSPDRQRAEPTIAVDPRNPSIIVAGAQDLRLVAQGEHRWHGFYRSIDGGVTWSSSLVPGFPGDNSPQGLASPLHQFNATSDPVLAFDDKGNVYYAGIALIISGTSLSSLTLFVAKYSNDGAAFAGVTLVGPPNSLADKPWIAVDTSGGPNDGNVYVVYSLGFTRSTDGGKTFSNPSSLPGDGGQTSITVDPHGNIFVLSVASQKGLFVTRSTDGGVAFQKPVTVAANITGLPPFHLPGNRFRAFTLPQIASDAVGVYVVWDDFRTGDADILFTRSLDGGTTWSSPLRVNDVAKDQQFFPSVAASAGTISVIWYDSRLGQLANGTITGLDVFYARSTDAGASFSKNLRVTSVSFNPNLVLRTDQPGGSQPFIGDYIQVAAGPTAVHPIWTDNRNACDTVDSTFGCVDQDAFTATVTF